MLVLAAQERFPLFFIFKPWKAWEPKLTGSRLFPRISVWSSGYLSVLGLSLFLPASCFHWASISFAAQPQIWCAQSCCTGCQIGLSFWTEVHRVTAGSLIPAAQQRSPGQEKSATLEGGEKRGGRFAFDCGLHSSRKPNLLWKKILKKKEESFSIQHWDQHNLFQCELHPRTPW